MRFEREIPDCDGHRLEEGIKISRGEENLFIWCFFLAVVQLAMDEEIAAYNWVKYIYIEDPISSLDENNSIAVAHDLAKVLRGAKNRVEYEGFFAKALNLLSQGQYSLYEPVEMLEDNNKLFATCWRHF